MLVAVAAGCGQASGNSDSVLHPATFDTPGGGKAASRAGRMPSDADATRIVRQLWTLREDVIGRNDAPGFESFEVGSARAIDSSYVQFVLCGCNEPKAGHELSKVVPIIPRDSVDGTFVAEVKTVNVTTDEKPWYVLGLRRVAGQWKIGFITFIGYKAPTPIPVHAAADGYVAPVTESTSAQLTHMATFAAHYADGKITSDATTSYGAHVRSRILVRPQADGVFGADLGKGMLLGCYTTHLVQTYRLDGGLGQDAGQHNWGPHLAPGAYRTITTDTAQSFCDLGEPTRNTRIAQYDAQQITATGTRLGA